MVVVAVKKEVMLVKEKEIMLIMVVRWRWW
jgi:hypothetical protein